jgi:peptidyl-prolyl cis-trans isomerase C
MSSQQGCGGGACTCGGGSAGPAGDVSEVLATDPIAPVARVNEVPLHGAGESPDPESLRQRAYTELLRQAAQQAGLLEASDRPALDGVPSAAASDAIELLLARELAQQEPDEAACQRFHAAHGARFALGERVHARHLLLAVTAGVDVEALRKRGEHLLVGLRCGDAAAFADAAREFSNCPSGAQGGELGWLQRGDCAPEFAAALFGQDEGHAHTGVLPRLICTRFGFHIVRVEAREPGQIQPYERVRGAIAQTLKQQFYVTALRQLLQRLAAEARLEGVVLDAADSPLLQ